MVLNIPHLDRTLQPLQQRITQLQNVSGVEIENSDLKQNPPVSKLHTYAQGSPGTRQVCELTLKWEQTVTDSQICKESLQCQGERLGCNKKKKKIPEKSKENLKKQSKPLNHVPREILEDTASVKW